MGGMPWARLREAIHLKDLSSDSLNIQIVEDFFHFILGNVMISSAPHYASDLLIYNVSYSSEHLRKHLNIQLFGKILRDLKFKVRLLWLLAAK